MIEIKDLNYKKGKKEILRNVSLHIKRNRLTAVIGPNGSGKTTLLRHLVGNIKSNNRIYLEGVTLEKISRKILAKKVVFVSQQSSFVAEMPLEDFIKMGRYPYRKLFSTYTKKDKNIVEQAIQKFSLEPFQKQKMGVLSGGEIKRAFLAKAFAQETELIILDEPTNHLDIQYQLALMKLLQSMKDRTRICSLHDINLALRFCEDVILMKEGKIVEYGSVKEVLTEENLERVFGVKNKKEKIDGQETIVFL